MLFKLKNNLKLPISSTEELGEICFNRKHFGVSYGIKSIDILNRVLTLELKLVRIKDNKLIKILKSIDCTDEGFNGKALNQEAYDEYITEKADIEEQISTLNATIDEKRNIFASIANEPDNEAPAKKIEGLITEVEELKSRLYNLDGVVLHFEKVDTFEQIKSYIVGGEFSDEGLKWWIKRVKDIVSIVVPNHLIEDNE